MLTKRVRVLLFFLINGNMTTCEVCSATYTLSYDTGSRRVAVRMAGTVYWVLVDGNGNKVGEKWYYPWGEERHTSGSLFTD